MRNRRNLPFKLSLATSRSSTRTCPCYLTKDKDQMHTMVLTSYWRSHQDKAGSHSLWWDWRVYIQVGKLGLFLQPETKQSGLHPQTSDSFFPLLVKLTEVTEQRQQVCGVAEPQRRQCEGHLGRMECHGEVLNKLGGQALLHQRHVGGHVVGQEDEHADVVIHLDLSNLNEQRTWTQGQDGSVGLSLGSWGLTFTGHTRIGRKTLTVQLKSESTPIFTG